MSTKNYRLTRAARDKLVKEMTNKLERGVPEEIIKRWVISTTSYTLSGAEHLLREAKMRADRERPVPKGGTLV